MDTRKIAVAAALATGGALAFAPLASADLGDTVTSTLDSEIASQNALFETYGALSGDTADITKGGTGVYDSIIASDLHTIAPQATT